MDVFFFRHFVLLFFIVFLVSAISTSTWISRAKKAGLTGKDMHKVKESQVAEMGGISVLLAFIVGVMIYIAIRIFVFETSTSITPLLAILTATLIAGFIGMIDDILGWKIGLRQWQKPLLTLLVAAPIMAINAGSKVMSFPIFGNINLGYLYPLFVIPGFILVGTNGFNMLAGYNGLEAGQGIIIFSALGILSYLTGSAWLSVVAVCMIFALLGFWLFNYYPAKIFPGDTLTYTVGALAAALAIMANLEQAFIILYIPYILEFFLKLRGRFQKESFAKVTADGTLVPRYDQIYGLENLFVKMMNGLNIRTTERKAVYCLHGFQLLFVILALAASLL
ncbi:MAG TPA: hypothetical protein VJI15_05600 [Candidatus Nanoarchaeia archaeon]|nr:hypothetical protein [Candidatus Nanoarchaeia archaeon]